MKPLVRWRAAALPFTVWFASLGLVALTASAPRSATAQAQASAAVREIEVLVDGGYQPPRIEAVAGERLRLRFVRRDYGPCTSEVVFPSLGLRRALPTGQTVLVELPPLPAGELEFHCAMHMAHGVIVARPRAAPATPGALAR